MKNVLVSGLLASIVVAPALAQTPAPQPRRIEAALAKEAVEAAIAACAADDIRISAAVVDAGGNPVYVLVPDGVRNGTGDVAIRKGITMTITGRAASETRGLIEADAEMKQKVEANPRSILFPGGVPLIAGDVMVGAIAGSGATGAQDEACARAGAERIAARIK